MSLAVSEIFGPTIQGEAKFTGQRCAFIRLGACNLSCSWCDTPYTWDAKRFDLKLEIAQESVENIIKQIVTMNVSMVVISGGEPLLQQKRDDFIKLLQEFYVLGIQVHIETNGTITPEPEVAELVAHFSVSPKLKNSGLKAEDRIEPEVLFAFNHLAKRQKALFKFVCSSKEDLEEVDALVRAIDINRQDVWIMPEGTTAHDIQSKSVLLADAVINKGWNFTTRLHTLIWGKERAH